MAAVKIRLRINENNYLFTYPGYKTVKNLIQFIENNFSECVPFLFSHKLRLIDVKQNICLQESQQFINAIENQRYVILDALFSDLSLVKQSFDRQSSFMETFSCDDGSECSVSSIKEH